MECGDRGAEGAAGKSGFGIPKNLKKAGRGAEGAAEKNLVLTPQIIKKSGIWAWPAGSKSSHIPLPFFGPDFRVPAHKGGGTWPEVPLYLDLGELTDNGGI